MTKTKITPFLWFEKDAEEAMNYYVSVFSYAPHAKKESRIVDITRYAEGMNVPGMPGMLGKVISGTFELEGRRFMALDGGPIFKPTEAVSFLIECEDQEEIDYFWNKLSGGSEMQCGWCKDKYGFAWQIVPDMTRWFKSADSRRSMQAMDAMLQMKKIEIKELDKAYES